MHHAPAVNYFGGVLSGNRGTKPSRLGILTAGRDLASIVSFGSMSLFWARM